MQIYIAPMTADLAALLAPDNESTYGSVTKNGNGNTDDRWYRTGQKLFSDGAFRVLDEHLIGEVDTYVQNRSIDGTDTIQSFDTTNFKELSLSKGEEYVLLFNNNTENDGTSGYALAVSEITLTEVVEEEEITDTKVNFKASAYTGGTVDKTEVQEVTIGADVTVTATPKADYTFAYWKNSAGVVLSTSATETFKVSTNMGVIAVFDEIPTDDAIPVYFYNGNGVPLGNASVAKDTTFATAKTAAGVPATPSLTGFVFSHWSDKDENVAIADGDLITALTRAVAIYEDDVTKTYTVKNGTAIVASGKKYGESVTVKGSDNFSCWKLGDKVISYEKDFTFNVYGDITLTEVTDETMTIVPVLVLDKVGGNYFLTYNAGNYELIEAGILFGSSGVSIASIDGYKAAAKRHTGQFTAQPHEGATESTIARGYMIYEDGGKTYVIYSE